MKHFLFVFCLVVASVCYGQSDSLGTIAGYVEKEEVEEEEYSNIMPTVEAKFDADESLGAFINRNLSEEYKTYIVKNKLHGKISCLITLDKNGAIKSAKIHKGIDPYLDNEIIRLIQQTKWKPAYSNNKAIGRRMVIPFSF